MNANQKVLANAMLEETLLESVIGALRHRGWRVAHFRPAKTEKGWRTAVQGDGKGFPDVIAVKPPRTLVVEAKTETGTVKPEQQRWLDDFKASGHEVYLWRPTQWLDGTIDRVLDGVPA